MSFVRQSKYRHVFGTAYKSTNCYTELRTNINAWDSNHIKANSQYIAVPWAGGGGSVAIINQAEPGKKLPNIPVLSGHSGPVLDFDFNPFNDNIIATGSADLTVKIWGIPEGGLTETITEPLVTLNSHEKKVGQVLFHPTSNNVLLTAGVDNKIKLWDIETGKEHISIGENEYKANIQSVCFNLDGSQFATTSKDKKIRIVDPRAAGQEFVTVADGHQGAKGSRIVWCKKLDKLFTVGFSKLSERQYMFWDPRDLSKPIVETQLDVTSGIIIPLFDEDSSIMYLAGKGDGNIRYFEIDDKEPFVHHLSDYHSSEPQRGIALVPKTAMDTSICEIDRLIKLTSNKAIPIQFQVPRKAESYQEDIYPDTFSPEPSQTAEDYFGGKNVEPKTSSMKPGENNFKSFKPAEFKPNVEKKAPKTELPKKTTSPNELLKQNDELRQRVEDLEKEVYELKKQLEEQNGSEATKESETTDAPVEEEEEQVVEEEAEAEEEE